MVKNSPEYQRKYMKTYSKSKELYHCDLCNSDVQRIHINRHNKSQRHVNLLKQQNDESNSESSFSSDEEVELPKVISSEKIITVLPKVFEKIQQKPLKKKLINSDSYDFDFIYHQFKISSMKRNVLLQQLLVVFAEMAYDRPKYLESELDPEESLDLEPLDIQPIVEVKSIVEVVEMKSAENECICILPEISQDCHFLEIEAQPSI